MSENGTVRGRKPSFSADPSGADDEEPTPAVIEEGDGGVAVAAPPMPRQIVAKGPNGEDLTLAMGDDGEWHTISTSVPPAPVSAPLDHPLLGQLRARTRKPKGRVQRAPAYNHRMLWYMKRDGSVVKLQGDPGNRAYYEDKGYVVLNEDETKLWEQDKKVTRFDPETGERKTTVVGPSIRKQVVAMQRKRAQLITMIRSIALRHAAVEVTGDLTITPTEELEAMLERLQAINGPNFTLLQGRVPEVEREFSDEEDNLDNLEVGRGDELERKMGRYREQMRIGGHQPLRPEVADLSGNS